MAVTQLYELDGVTVTSSELSIVTGTTSLGNATDAGAIQLWIDASAMAKGDEFRVRGYEKVEGTGGTKRVFFAATLLGAQSENFVTGAFMLMNSWDFTIQKIAGTDRTFDASIRKA